MHTGKDSGGDDDDSADGHQKCTSKHVGDACDEWDCVTLRKRFQLASENIEDKCGTDNVKQVIDSSRLPRATICQTPPRSPYVTSAYFRGK